jgi:hypothetical protein
MDLNNEWFPKRLERYQTNKDGMYEPVEELYDMDKLG